MTISPLLRRLLVVAAAGASALACGNGTSNSVATGGSTRPPLETGGSTTTASGGERNATGGATAPGATGGITTPGTTGGITTPRSTGGVRATGGTTGSGGGVSRPDAGPTATGGRTVRSDASVTTGGSAPPATGGTSTSSLGDGGVISGEGCTIGAWPMADPSKAGPYKTVTENDVGPSAGQAPDGGVAPKFTLFRPANLAEVNLCHPVITWGNGTGSTPNVYSTLLKHFASHGFVVIASNNPNVARGTPAPMVVGVTWVLEQNEDPASPLYHRIDTTHIGATGHSQGAMATSTASGDPRITVSIPIEGASVQRKLSGPAMFFCGTLDDIVGCTGAANALAAVTTLPAMYAELTTVDHGSWMSRGSTLSVADTAFTAWMRVHLMGDTALRPWFYGADCKLCTDATWKIDRKNMDQ